MKISALDFTNGNNAAISLRVISEKARSGDWIVTAERKADGSLLIETREKSPNKRSPDDGR